MKVLVQINVTLNQGSTGRIADSIACTASNWGWKCYMIHGARYINFSKYESFLVSSPLEEKLHYINSLLLDGQGLGSTAATNALVKKLCIIKPDIIHLHVIHGSYINFKILFKFIKRKNIPVIWTFHDCWAFTGHCVFFDQVNCNKWMVCCNKCPQKNTYPKSLFLDMSKRNYLLKKSLFSSVEKMVTVPVSEWLGNYVKKSFFNNKPMIIIHNGIDINLFRPVKYDIYKKYLINTNKIIVLGVANGFSNRKGLNDFIKLSYCNDFQIILIGISNKEKSNIPNNVITIHRTENIEILINFYSSASVFANPTYEDNFPTTNLEALACGTPVVAYDTGGCNESIDVNTGVIVPKGNIELFKKAIYQIAAKDRDKIRYACRKRAVELYDKNKCFEKYIYLYNKVIGD